MSKQRYDWVGANKAIQRAILELFAAQRHRNHSKRVNVLNDLIAAEAEIRKVRQALSGEPEADPARFTPVAGGTETGSATKHAVTFPEGQPTP